MVLVKPAPDPANAAYLLLDDVGERLCATGAYVPGYIRQSDSCFPSLPAAFQIFG